jgi:hypothetical protein
METNNSYQHSDRRNFLSKCFAAGSMICLGCTGMAAAIAKPVYTDDLPQTGLNYEEAIRYALGYSVPLLQKMQVQMGKLVFFDALEKSASARAADMVTAMAKDIKEKTMKKYGELLIKSFSVPPLKDGIQFEIVENTDKVFEMKVTGCIMAKLYREMNAFNIGYAIECHPSDAAVKAFNPNAKCIKSKNMMIGDPVCTERYELA